MGNNDLVYAKASLIPACVFLSLFLFLNDFDDEDYSIVVSWIALGSLIIGILKPYVLAMSIVFQTALLSDIIGQKGCFQVDASIFVFIILATVGTIVGMLTSFEFEKKKYLEKFQTTPDGLHLKAYSINTAQKLLF